MAPPSVSAAIRLGITARGGQRAGGEAAFAALVRERLRVQPGARPSEAALRVRLLYGCEPIVRYLLNSLDDAEWASLTAAEVGEAVREVLRQVLVLSRILAAYRDIVESNEAWDRLSEELLRLRDGATAEEPGSDDCSLLESGASRRLVSLLGVLAGVAAHQWSVAESASGRDRGMASFYLGLWLGCNSPERQKMHSTRQDRRIWHEQKQPQLLS